MKRVRQKFLNNAPEKEQARRKSRVKSCLSASVKRKKPFAQQSRIAFPDTPQQTKAPAQSSVRGFDVQLKFAGIRADIFTGCAGKFGENSQSDTGSV